MHIFKGTYKGIIAFCGFIWYFIRFIGYGIEYLYNKFKHLFHSIIMTVRDYSPEYAMFWFWLYIFVFIGAIYFISFKFPKSISSIYGYINDDNGFILTIIAISFPVIYFFIDKTLSAHSSFNKISSELIMFLSILEYSYSSLGISILLHPTISSKFPSFNSLHRFNIVLLLIYDSLLIDIGFMLISLIVIGIVCVSFWVYKSIMNSMISVFLTFFVSSVFITFMLFIIIFNLQIRLMSNRVYYLATHSNKIGWIFVIGYFSLIFIILGVILCLIFKFHYKNSIKELGMILRIIFWFSGYFSVIGFILYEIV